MNKKSHQHGRCDGQPVLYNKDKDLRSPAGPFPKSHTSLHPPDSCGMGKFIQHLSSYWSPSYCLHTVSHSSGSKRAQPPFQQSDEQLYEPWAPKGNALVHSGTVLSVHGRVPDCVSFCWSLRTNSSRFICIVTSCEKRRKTTITMASLNFTSC